MSQTELPRDHLTDYERAVCYYTLPRVTHPLTYGLIVAYAVCIFEAIGAIVIGYILPSGIWMNAGSYALGALVIFGLVVFTIRSLLNEVRQRRALASARNAPDAEKPLDIPDPFENHILLKHPSNTWGTLFACTQDDATIEYFVDSVRRPPDMRLSVRPKQLSREDGARPAHSPYWRVRSSEDTEICQVEVVRGARSFTFGVGLENTLSVTIEGREAGLIQPRFSLRAPAVEITWVRPPQSYLIRQQGIYFDGRLVGRIYYLRGSYYLDVEQEHFNEAILGYFITLT